MIGNKSNAWGSVCVLYAAALFGLGACGPVGGDNSNTQHNSNYNTNGAVCSPDTDGDGICDSHEGAALGIDTDNDGTPDYLDLDSDGDGIADSVESGGFSTPVDSDGDGTPDFRDTDSDNNYILDADDGAADIDQDGVGNYADMDDDGDGILDVAEMGFDPNNPRDTDGDGTPDYQDVDADGDTILDGHEGGGGQTDTDEDGLPDYLDLDSDNDGIPDAAEAGDPNPSTPPRDTDGDQVPDFRDVDSDNDGLADADEDLNHNGIHDPGESNAYDSDSDDDGVSDMIEVAAGTDPNNNTDNPQENGDFVFLVPFEDVASPPEDRLDFSTAFQNVDVYFLIDYSGSMSGEITSIHNNIATVIDALVCSPGEDPAVTNCIPSLETGTGHYGGSPSDPPMWNDKDINNVNLIADGPNSTEALIISSAPGYGQEEHVQAMDMTVGGTCASDPTRTGLACWRPSSLRVLVLATDEPFTEDPVWPGQAQPYLDNVANNDIVLIGVYGSGTMTTLIGNLDSLQGGTPPHDLIPTLTTTNIDTDACNALSGNPFYNNKAIIAGADTNAADAMTCAVQAVTAYVDQDIYAEPENDPTNQDGNGDPVDAPAEFIDYIEVFMNGSAECPDYPDVADTNSDGHADVFEHILPGSPVCWKIYVKDNYTVEPASYPLMFRATVNVFGAGNALLDARDVFFLVPPVIEGPGGPT